MAADKLVADFHTFVSVAHTGFKYNLQVLPDTLTAGTLLFSLLFQSASLGALGGSMVLLNFLHPRIAGFLGSALQGIVKPEGSSSSCTGHYPGVSLTRVAEMATGRTFGAVDYAGWPSFYATFLGFLGAYVGTIPSLYSKEIAASPRRRAASTTGLLMLIIILVTCSVYRVMSGCDSLPSLLVGLLVGGIVGFFFVMFLAWISDRRITNIVALPLMRGKAIDGKPIYVCEGKSA